MEAIKARVRDIEMESSKLKSLQQGVNDPANSSVRLKQESEGRIPALDVLEEKIEVDGR